MDIKSIKATLSVREVAERYLGEIDHGKVTCPCHSDNTPSLHIYEQNDTFYCFQCQRHGDALDLAGLAFYGSAYDQRLHFKPMLERLGVSEYVVRPHHAHKETPPAPKPPLGVSLAQAATWNLNLPAAGRAFWESRGLDARTMDFFLLGWDGGRLTIPHVYRTTVFGVKRRLLPAHPDGHPAKYTSLTGSRSGLFNADIVVRAQDGEPLLICEGEVDCMTAHQMGYAAISPTAGAGTWRVPWSLFLKDVPRIFVLYDNDEAGRQGAKRVIALLPQATLLCLPTAYKDLNEFHQADRDTAAAWLTEALDW